MYRTPSRSEALWILKHSLHSTPTHVWLGPSGSGTPRNYIARQMTSFESELVDTGEILCLPLSCAHSSPYLCPGYSKAVADIQQQNHQDGYGYLSKDLPHLPPATNPRSAGLDYSRYDTVLLYIRGLFTVRVRVWFLMEVIIMAVVECCHVFSVMISGA